MTISLTDIVSDVYQLADRLDKIYENDVGWRVRDYADRLAKETVLLEESNHIIIMQIKSMLRQIETSGTGNTEELIETLNALLGQVSQNLEYIDDSLVEVSTSIESSTELASERVAGAIGTLAGEIGESFRPLIESIQSAMQQTQEEFDIMIDLILEQLQSSNEEFAFAIQELTTNLLLSMVTYTNMIQASIESTGEILMSEIDTNFLLLSDMNISLSNNIQNAINANWNLLSEYMETTDDRFERLLNSLEKHLEKISNFIDSVSDIKIEDIQNGIALVQQAMQATNQ